MLSCNIRSACLSSLTILDATWLLWADIHPWHYCPYHLAIHHSHSVQFYLANIVNKRFWTSPICLRRSSSLAISLSAMACNKRASERTLALLSAVVGSLLQGSQPLGHSPLVGRGLFGSWPHKQCATCTSGRQVPTAHMEPSPLTPPGCQAGKVGDHWSINTGSSWFTTFCLMTVQNYNNFLWKSHDLNSHLMVIILFSPPPNSYMITVQVLSNRLTFTSGCSILWSHDCNSQLSGKKNKTKPAKNAIRKAGFA